MASKTGIWFALCILNIAGVAQTADLEGIARGFPALRDSAGKSLADGNFVQWLEDERLHVRITYHFNGDRRIEENAIFRQRPRLVQEQWSLREDRDGKLYRHFQVDFNSRTAATKKLEKGELKQSSEKIEVESGKAFAGFGYACHKGIPRAYAEGRKNRVESGRIHAEPPPRNFMRAVGVIEMLVGIGILSPRTRLSSYAAGAWLLAIAGNLYLKKDYDIAVRDINMALGAFALAQLSAAREEEVADEELVDRRLRAA